MPRTSTWTDEDLAKAILNAKNWKEAIIALNLYPGNKTRERVRVKANKLGLDTSHFVKGQAHPSNFDPFVRGIEFNTTTKRYYLKIVPYECKRCGASEWLGEPLILQVDHVDGNRWNNLLENLRLLCPNCHSQTPTWSRNKSKCK